MSSSHNRPATCQQRIEEYLFAYYYSNIIGSPGIWILGARMIWCSECSRMDEQLTFGLTRLKWQFLLHLQKCAQCLPTSLFADGSNIRFSFTRQTFENKNLFVTENERLLGSTMGLEFTSVNPKIKIILEWRLYLR